MNVLVIEDNWELAQLIRETMKSHNISIELTDNTFEAFQLFSQNNYDAVICDVCLPDGDGLEILTRMKACPDKDCLLIGMSGFVKNSSSYICQELELDGFIDKPFKTIDVLRSLGLTASHKSSNEAA